MIRTLLLVAALVILIAALFVLGHHEWHHQIVSIMNDITSLVTGSK